MNITIFAAGSRGDIQPCLALAKGLLAAGYQARMAAPNDFSELIRLHGIEIRPLRGDVQKVMSSEEGRDFLAKGGSNPIHTIMSMRRLISTVVMDMAHDAYEACRDADALICLGVFSPFGATIADVLQIPVLNIEPTPLLPTADFPAPSWPLQQNLGGLHNRLSGIAMLYSVWLWYRPYIRKFRRELGLSDRSAGDFYRLLRSTPMIGAYSSHIIPHPADWPESLHITGDLPLRDETVWKPPADLRAFLDEGSSPVYIGFGSMTGTNPEELSSLIVRALEKTEQRGLIMTGWSGMKAIAHSNNIFIMDHAPHDWLFPRMKVVVHHGGAGTTAEGLRAGIPSVIIPFAFDQYFWGERIRKMRLGPNFIPRTKLTVNRLADAIKEAATDSAMRQRAADCGAAIQSTDGIHNAVNVVRKYFGEPDGNRSEFNGR